MQKNPVNKAKAPKIASHYYKLNATQKKAMVKYITCKASVATTAKVLNVSHQRVYCISNALLRHAAATGVLDVEAVVKGY
jgi:hypothetical protein